MVAFAIATGVTRAGAAADSPALSGYEAYVNSIRSIEFHSKFNDRNAESKVFTNSLSQDWKIDFVNKRRWCVTDKPAAPNSLTARFFGSKTYSENLIVPGQAIELSVNSRTDQADWCMADLTVPQYHWEGNWGGLLYLGYPFGYIRTGATYQNILDVLRGDDLKSIAVKGEGALVVLKCTTSTYEIVLSLDPKKDWMPEQIECSRVAAPTEPSQLTLAKYIVQKSSQHDGVWLPDTFNCREEFSGGTRRGRPGMHVKKGIFGTTLVYYNEADKDLPGDIIEVPASGTYAECALSDVKLNTLTERDFQLQAKTPDGLQVNFHEPIPSEEYEWQSGIIVQRQPAGN